MNKQYQEPALARFLNYLMLSLTAWAFKISPAEARDLLGMCGE